MTYFIFLINAQCTTMLTTICCRMHISNSLFLKSIVEGDSHIALKEFNENQMQENPGNFQAIAV